MYLRIIIHFLLFLFDVIHCQRRIQNGHAVEASKNYMVYLLKAPPSPRKYLGWVCGGAIVSEWFIVTSAACVEDVEHLYAIAGYDKYVRPRDITANECTKQMKKKIVFTCVPKKYEFSFQEIQKWAHIDIAVVKVESAYDFNDENYERYCSYRPYKIDVNYERKYQEPGTDAMVLGWGHQRIWRNMQDTKIYNTEILHYASVLIVHKEICKESYKEYPSLLHTIDYYMICADGTGNLDEFGERIEKVIPRNKLVNGCSRSNKTALAGDLRCDDDYDDPYADVYENDDQYEYEEETSQHPDQDIPIDKTYRRIANKDLPLDNDTVKAKSRRNMNAKYLKYKRSRRTNENDPLNNTVGFCQNDHGGPLITWVGTREVLIGVATAFIISENSTCDGPYLYTSTQCNGAFLDCIINADNTTDTRRALCENPAQRGYELIQRRISWVDHPAGPADNEVLYERPQIPLRDLYKKSLDLT